MYTIQIAAPLGKWTGLRLEVLADKSLPKSGPGRAANGNFGLSKLSITVKAKPEEPAAAVKIAKAQATFEQNQAGLSIASSLDDDPRTGWAVDPQFGKDNAALFTFAEPLVIAEGATLTIALEFRVNGQHNIGRFRLAVTGENEPRLDGESTPAEIAKILAKSPAPAEFESLPADSREKLFDWRKKSDAQWRVLQSKVAEHKNHPPSSKTNIMICGEGYKPMRHHTQGADFFNETHFLERGSVDRKSGVATQSFLQVLMPSRDSESKWQWKPPPGAKFSGRRRSLANWIVDVDEGAGTLAARVAVNRLWQHHFGRGIVATPNDFGHTGTAPSHPELLEWLAGELIRGEWKQKPLHKLIMTSTAYMQSTTATDDFKAMEKADPNNDLLTRRTPRRLEAEAIRDSLLAVSGSLDPKMFGPGTRDENSTRRSIYFMIKRSQLIGSMVVFDQPEPLVSQGQRPTTTVAPQALMIMNGPQVRRWAESFAKRVESAAPVANDFRPAVERAYWIAVSRSPDEKETKAAVDFLESQTAQYAKASRANGRSVALADFCQALFGLNELAYEE